MTTQPITAEAFKNRAFRIITLPGFNPGDERIPVQIKSTGVMTMLSNGTIPNTLMVKVTELFGNSNGKTKNPKAAITKADKQAAIDKLNSSESGLQDMASLLRVFAKASLVQPSYDEIGDYLTDEQLMTLFSAMYGEVTDLESFRN